VAPFSSCAEPGHRGLPGNLSLKLCESAKEVKRPPALRRGGVDAFGQRHELDAAFVEGLDLGDEIF